MATLVVQLARFGDIYQTWPVLKALRRTRPSEEIHLLVRERFQEATEGLEELGVRIHVWPTKAILEPLVANDDPAVALRQMQSVLNGKVEELADFGFSRIINLSFSPFSSFLTDALKQANTSISGYSRHSDGFLAIPDDSSAYFYAQVGIGRPNRYHVTDVFAAVAGVDLIDEDFSHPAAVATRSSSIVVHLGASQADKTYPADLWVKALSELARKISGPFILVGSANERPLAETVENQVSSDLIVNRVGQSTLRELCTWIAESRLVIGADSAPAHIASLMNTPMLNLSSRQVNFWETGPISTGSRILYGEDMAEISPEHVVTTALSMLNGEEVSVPHFKRTERRGAYESVATETDDFDWRLLQALYTASDYPPLAAETEASGFQRLREIAELALEQMKIWSEKGPNQTMTSILQSADEMLHKLPALAPKTAPVIRWFETERLRIGPMSSADLLSVTIDLFDQLKWVASVYDPNAESLKTAHLVEVSHRCGQAFREFDGALASPLFIELTSMMHSQLSNQTSVLKRMTTAMESRDWIELADILQFEIPKLVAGPGNDNMEAWNRNHASSS